MCIRDSSQLSSTIEERLGNFGSTIGNSLTQQTQNTQKSLMEMHERLAVIDRAQENINSLSNQVNDLQNILSNKQLRGAFGEVQLENIVKDALPQNAYQFQYTLMSNARVDCIVCLLYTSPSPRDLSTSRMPSSA